MERYYSVTHGREENGKVLVRRQGLYYHFHCRCRLEGGNIYRLMVTCGTRQENLGVLIPQDGSFVLDTKQPVKRIGEGDMSFSLVPKKESVRGTFVPICPEEPFAYISRLKTNFLVLRNGQPGIYINNMQEC